jgi:hypothetical protein
MLLPSLSLSETPAREQHALITDRYRKERLFVQRDPWYRDIPSDLMFQINSGKFLLEHSSPHHSVVLTHPEMFQAGSAFDAGLFSDCKTAGACQRHANEHRSLSLFHHQEQLLDPAPGDNPHQIISAYKLTNSAQLVSATFQYVIIFFCD